MTQRLVREMHETLRKLVASNNAMVEAVAAQGTHLQSLSAQMGALGERLIVAEEVQDDLDARVSSLEKKKGGGR